METEVNRIGRVVKMLTTLQSGRSLDADTLAGELKTSRRTIFRDLRHLRKAGIEVCYDSKSRRYAIKSELFWPANGLNAQEMLSLLLLVHKANDHIHLPFNDLALLAAQKIEKNLPEELKRCCDDAIQDISVKTYRPVKTGIFDRVFLQIRQAVLKRRTVKIQYYLYDEKNIRETELNPYHMVCVQNAWYVIGKTGEQGIRTFKLSQIQQLTVLDKFFVRDAAFNVRDYLGRAWAAMPEGQLYDVKLEFSSEIARTVTEVQWHSTQMVTFDVDGSVIVEFCVDGLNELIPWILSFGDKVKVVGPEVLRQEIVRISQKTAERNRTFGYTVAE